MSDPGAIAAHPSHVAHEVHHEELGFWRKYVFSTDHKVIGDARMPGGTMLPEFYNELGAMHGTIMVFLGVVPLAVGGFGNFVLPLQIGAPDMAFPKINMVSYWNAMSGAPIWSGSTKFPKPPTAR